MIVLKKMTTPENSEGIRSFYFTKVPIIYYGSLNIDYDSKEGLIFLYINSNNNKNYQSRYKSLPSWIWPFIFPFFIDSQVISQCLRLGVSLTSSFTTVSGSHQSPWPPPTPTTLVGKGRLRLSRSVQVYRLYVRRCWFRRLVSLGDKKGSLWFSSIIMYSRGLIFYNVGWV